MTAAEPFLAKAKRIVLLSVAEDDNDDPSLAGMADYLALTGLSVETSRIVDWRHCRPWPSSQRLHRTMKF